MAEGMTDPCEVGGAARRRRRRWQRLMHALHGNGDSEGPPSPTYSPPVTDDEEEGVDGVVPMAILQRVGPSWDVGCATDRVDERPAAPLHQFTPNADAEAHLVLPGGALALERCWGVRSLVERCLAFFVQQHPMLFWGWHGSKAAAEWLTLEFEHRGYFTISAICRLNAELLAREYRRLWDIELLVDRLLGPLNQLWHAHRVENQTAEQRDHDRFSGCLSPVDLWQHANRVLWVYGMCRTQQQPLAVGRAMMRQERYWLPGAQHSLEMLWAVFESAAWTLLSSGQRLQVMVAVTLQIATNWQYNNGRAARGRDEAITRRWNGFRRDCEPGRRRR